MRFCIGTVDFNLIQLAEDKYDVKIGGKRWKDLIKEEKKERKRKKMKLIEDKKKEQENDNNINIKHNKNEN